MKSREHGHGRHARGITFGRAALCRYFRRADRRSKIYDPSLMVCVRARNLGRKFQYFDVQFGLRSHHKFDGKTYVVDGVFRMCK